MKLITIAALAGLLVLPGCAAGGLFCKNDHEDPQIASLMDLTCNGDRHAAMQLGFLFEARQEYEEAAHYYGVAATPSAGQIYIWVPPAGDVAGYVMPVDTGPRTPGNAEAQYRLALMYREGKGVKLNEKKARSLLERAAEQGHESAKTLLAEAKQS